MTDKEILDKVYEELNHSHLVEWQEWLDNRLTAYWRVKDIRNFIEQEWQEQDEEQKK